jgi:serine phosphatase RsbU (regulator of sigma subunit)
LARSGIIRSRVRDAAPSITASEAFQFRAQRSEASRLLLMSAVFAVMLIVLIARRMAGGVVMSTDAVFYPRLVLTAAAIILELALWAMVRRATRENRLMPAWLWIATAIFELAVPTAMMMILHMFSPRGEYAAISAPPLMVFPIVVLMSVLRLRPMFALCTGLGAAAAHWALVLWTIDDGAVAPEHWPVLLAYGVSLALMGVMAMVVTHAARRYVIEAVEEATARERDAQRLAAIERDLSVAREIQAGLLPRNAPRLRGFDIAGLNQPADKTGGDYYDWQELPDGRLLVVMADVTGHGIGPALVMAVCRAYARASAPLERDPASLLSRLNALLHADLQGGRFITLAAALLNDAGEVELVSAGHGPTLVCRAGGVGRGADESSVERFGGDGLPLAVIESESYGPSRRFALKHGEVIVMLTDGVFEWKNAQGEQFGLERLSDAVARASGQGAKQIVQGIYRAVHDFAGGSPQEDDVTVVVVKRTG